MVLLHHFIVASRDFNLDGTPTDPEDDDPICTAFKHHYLLHSILALSALQLYFKQPVEYGRYKQAVAHQDAAIRQARPHLKHLAKQHAEAMFWFSVFTSQFALAEPLLRPASVEPAMNPIDELLNSFGLTRGIRQVMDQLDPGSKLAQVTTNGKYADNREDLKPNLEKKYPQLEDLRAFIRARSDDLTDQEVSRYIEVAEELMLFIAVLQHDASNKKTTNLIMVWAIQLPESFLHMCQARNVIAIAVLSFYAVAMHTRQNFWFFSGWPEVLLEACGTVLKEKAIDCDYIVKWPKQVIVGT